MLLVPGLLEIVTLLQVPGDDTHEASQCPPGLREKMVSVLKSFFPASTAFK